MSVLLFALAQAAEPALDYGVPISYEQGVEIGEKWIKADLLDPYSAHIEWPFSFVQFTEKVPLFKRTTGYATCVRINAKNTYGGYTGEKTYRIIIRNNQVIDYSEVSNLRMVPDICKELVEKYGMIPVQKPHTNP